MTDTTNTVKNFEQEGSKILNDLELLYKNRIDIIMEQVRQIKQSLPEDLSKADHLRSKVVGIRIDISILSIEIGSEYKHICSILEGANAHEKREKTRIKQEIVLSGSSLGKITLVDAATAKYNKLIDSISLDILHTRGAYIKLCLEELTKLDTSMREVSISIGSASKLAREHNAQ